MGLNQRIIRQAVAGAHKAGMKVERLEIDPHTGRITMMTGQSPQSEASDLDAELNAWRQKNGQSRS